MTVVAIHRVRHAAGGRFEPVGAWEVDDEVANAFYPPEHETYRGRAWKVIAQRPMPSAEQWIRYKSSTSPSWQLYQPEASLFAIEEIDAASAYEHARGEHEKMLAVSATGTSVSRSEWTASSLSDLTSSDSSGWGANRFAVAQSWWLASELVRRHPELMTYEMHPGGGQYDVLCVATPDQFSPNPPHASPRVMLNRVGTIQIHRGHDSEAIAGWREVLEAETPHEVVKEIEFRTGWITASPTPKTDHRSITYRFFAAALAMLVNDRFTWDVRSESVDSSESGMSRAGLIGDFDDVSADFETTPRLRIFGEPESHYWALRRGSETVAVVSIEGNIYRRGHQRRSLLEAYDKAGRKLLPMTTAMLREWM